MKKNYLFMGIILGIILLTFYVIDNQKRNNLISKFDSNATNLSLNEKKVTLKPNETFDAKEYLSIQDEVLYVINDENIATVNNSGIVKAKNDGLAILSAIFDNGQTINVKVIVESSTSKKEVKLEKIILNEITKDILVGQSYKIGYELYPTNSTNVTIKYTSNNESVASVSEKGVVIAKKEGKAVISVCSNNDICEKININVTTVEIGITSIKVYPSEVKLNVKETANLNVSYVPSNALGTVKWSSSDNSIVKVENGKITALRKGSAYITATLNGKKSDAFVVVSEPIVVPTIKVTSIKLNKSSVKLEEGKTFQITYNILPTNATNKNVTFTSSNNNVVTVTNTGLVTAISSGTGTIKVLSVDNLCSKLTVTVSKKVEPIIKVSSITFDKSSIELKKNETFQITFHILPTNATNKNVTFTSSNNNILTVTNTGLVTALSSGTGTIKVCSVYNLCSRLTVTVLKDVVNVESILLNYEKTNLKINQSKQLRATILPTNATDKTVIWVSSNPNIVKVSNNGLIKAINSGKVTITALSNNGKRVDMEVLVLPDNDDFKYGEKLIGTRNYCLKGGTTYNREYDKNDINNSLNEYIDNAYEIAEIIGDIDPKRAQVLAAAYFLGFNPYCKVRYAMGFDKASTTKGWYSNWTSSTGIDSLGFIKWSYYQVFKKNYENSILGKYKKEYNENGLNVMDFIDIALPGDILVKKAVLGITDVAMVLSIDYYNEEINVIKMDGKGINVETISGDTKYIALTDMSRIFD